MIAALMILGLLVVAVGACLWTLQDDSDIDPRDENQGRGDRHE